ncbi:MAG TPA: gephyrin-like molybdotransferase Glp, partial [Herpetosiphonaceae bacterium]
MQDHVVLRSVDDAQAEILRHFRPLEIESVPLSQALGRTLAAPAVADAPIPGFANSAMDGYAVLAADVAAASPAAPVTLRIVSDLAAGYVAQGAVTPGATIRIMTGAPLPAGADAVVPFEETDEQAADSLAAQGLVRIYQPAAVGNNVRPAGEDLRAGELALAPGTLIRPAEIGVLATVGAALVPVHRRPRVAILATGDELVDVGERPGPGQIRNSNGYANLAQVLAAGGEPLQLPVARDTEAEVAARIEEGLAWGADLFLTSGGVSVGDFDVVKKVLTKMGRLEFWRVKMRPGKPLVFGWLRETPFIGLPGNPVSAMVCFELFARPALLAMAGRRNLGRPTLLARFEDELE